MLAIEAGQFKVPYGLQRQYWKAELEFVDISAPMAAFSLERDVGLMLVGRLLPGRLDRSGRRCSTARAPTSPNDNIDLAYALRIVATPFGPLPVTEGDIEGHVRPLLSVGAAGYYNLVPTDIVARIRHSRRRRPTPAATDGSTTSPSGRGARAARALARRRAAGRAVRPPRGSRARPAPDRNYWGGYVQGSYFVLPHRLQVAARVGHTDLPLYGATARRSAAGGHLPERAERRGLRLPARPPHQGAGRLQPPHQRRADGPHRQPGAGGTCRSGSRVESAV